MLKISLVIIGGGLGALLRYGVSSASVLLWGRGFPYGTLLVNVTGSFVIGVCYVLMLERIELDPAWQAAWTVGLLGGFTTFSSFSIETIHLIEAEQWARAGINILASLALCLLACWLGVALGRRW